MNMGLFDSLFGKKESRTYQDSDIVAVVSGPVVNNADIPDPVFAQEMLGKTFAVKPSGVKAVAPANGTLEVLFPTGHAFAVRTADGTGLLVHIGIDTVNLKGKGFKVMASQGDVVKAGQTISLMDLANAVHAENRKQASAKRDTPPAKRPSVLARLNEPLPQQMKKQKSTPKKNVERGK